MDIILIILLIVLLSSFHRRLKAEISDTIAIPAPNPSIVYLAR